MAAAPADAGAEAAGGEGDSELLRLAEVRDVYVAAATVPGTIGLSTYCPSIYGVPERIIDPATDLHYLPTEADWIARLQMTVKDFRDMKHPVLVYFKNERQLQLFTLPGSRSITERTPAKVRDAYVAAATVPGTVTVLTRAFARGVDFRPRKPADGAGEQESTVVVIHTFLSSMRSEETQCLGRTARQGQKGRYVRVLCGEHLQTKFHIDAEQWEAHRRAGSLETLLHDKQAEKMRLKAQGRSQRKAEADRRESQTQEWRRILESGRSAAEKFKALSAMSLSAGSSGPVHYTLLLDGSGSMRDDMGGRTRWQRVCHATEQMRAELLASPMAECSTMSIVVFHGTASLKGSCHMKPGDAPRITDADFPNGGTNFGAAFDKCAQTLGRSPAGTNEVILFLTDGEASVPEAVLRALLRDHGQRIRQFICVGLCTDAPPLTAIVRLFEEGGVDAKLMPADSGESLVTIFTQAVGSMHT